MTTTDHLHFSALPLHRQRRRKTGEMDEDYLDSVEPSSPLATSSAPSRGPPAVDGSSNHTNAPTPFLKGIGLSVWQNSSDEHSQWTHFIKKNHYYGDRSTVTARAMEKSNDFWHLYEQHILLAKSMGITSFRFSFEWARLEPTGPGQWDPAAFRRFHDIIDCIRKHGLEPFATLHHFTHPQWFEELHSFEREENIAFFLRYARHVFAEFSSKVKFWATFNEPTCFSFVGYIVGLWSPGHHGRMEMCGRVLAHLLKAHTAAYRQLKSMPGGREAQIGIVHQHISFFPKQAFWPHVRLLCKWMTYWFAAEVILKFFSTGIYEWKAPFRGVVVRFVDADAPDTLDWWGINYYSRPCINAFFGMGPSNANEPVGDSHFRCFPEGLMMSIREASVLRVPIYITETGVADKDSRYRQYFIETHFSVILKALAEGYDIRGVFFWTLMDNIEWHELFHIKFGLFAWDPAKCGCPGELPLRPGGETLRRLYEEWPDTVDQMRGLALQQQGDSLMSRKAASASTESLLPKHPPNPLAMQLMGNPLYDVRMLRQDSAAIPLTGGNAASRRS